MPTKNVNLTAQQSAFVDKMVKSGEYQNASEAIRDAIRALQQRRREDELRLKRLRREIDLGIEALERGDFVELGKDEIDGFIRELGEQAASQTR